MKRHKKLLTEKQQYVYNFMKSFFLQNDQLPPMATIADHFGWASDNAAQEMIRCIEKAGWIERNAVNKWRFVRDEL